MRGAELDGTVLEERYQVESLIARGGMSSVYRGVDTRLERRVAIKVMDPRFAEDASFLRRFELEARAAAGLHHPHVVAVHDQGVHSGPSGQLPYLVMELLGGGTLRDLLDERDRLDVPLAVSVLDPILSALAAAHRGNLVHRDVKPENVLIGLDGTIKVADFGLVRAVASAHSSTGNTVLGTLAYLSPEQIATGKADAGSDVYSAGIVAFEMLTGTVPYTGDTAISVAYQHVNGDVPAAASLRSELPAELSELVMRATRRDTQARPTDAGAFRAQLQTLRERLGIEPRTVPVPAGAAERTAPVSAVPALAALGSDAAVASQEANTVPRTQVAPPEHAPSGGPRGTRAMSRSELDSAKPPWQPERTPEHTPPPRQDQPGMSQQEYVADVKRGRRKLAVWVLVMLLLGGLVGVGTWWFASGRYTTVPNLDGMDRAAARSALTGADLEPRFRNRPNNTVPAGAVVSADPRVGSEALRGDEVMVLISTGRPTVPDIAEGSPVAAARRALTEAGLRARQDGTANVFDESIPEGAVVRVTPASGTPVRIGATVTLVLSKGPPPQPVPEVAGQSRAEAFRTLRDAGFQPYEADRQFSADVPGGQVLGTDPPSGTTVDTEEQPRIGVVLSNAVRIPGLRGELLSDARERLESAGLEVTVRQFVEQDDSRVIQQSPEEGSLVEPGSTVTLVAFP